MRRIESGEIPVRREDGFMFVDVAPYGARVERPNRAPGERPATWVTIDTIDDEEVAPIAAPAAGPPAAADHVAGTTPEPEPTVMLTDEEATILLMPASDEAEMGPIDDTASTNLGDWRAARRKAARTRIPPQPRRLSA